MYQVRVPGSSVLSGKFAVLIRDEFSSSVRRATQEGRESFEVAQQTVGPSAWNEKSGHGTRPVSAPLFSSNSSLELELQSPANGTGAPVFVRARDEHEGTGTCVGLGIVELRVVGQVEELRPELETDFFADRTPYRADILEWCVLENIEKDEAIHSLVLQFNSLRRRNVGCKYLK